MRVKKGFPFFRSNRSSAKPNKASAATEKSSISTREASPTPTTTTTSTCEMSPMARGSKIFPSDDDTKRKPLVESVPVLAKHNELRMSPTPPPPLPPPQKRQKQNYRERQHIQQQQPCYTQQSENALGETNSTLSYNAPCIPDNKSIYVRGSSNCGKEIFSPSIAENGLVEEPVVSDRKALGEKSPTSAAIVENRTWENTPQFFQQQQHQHRPTAALTAPHSPLTQITNAHDSPNARRHPSSPGYIPTLPGDSPSIETNTTAGDSTMATWFQHWHRVDRSLVTEFSSDCGDSILNTDTNKNYERADPEQGHALNAGGAFSGMGDRGPNHGNYMSTSSEGRDCNTHYVLDRTENVSDKPNGDGGCSLTMGMEPEIQTACSDFHEDEWTPQDSAYGAACPFCGWVPKRTRRIMEASLIGLMVIGIVYAVIAVSVHITELHKAENASSSATDNYYVSNYVNDDYYVSNNANDDGQ